MVGSGGVSTAADRSKEAVGMMALHEALRGVVALSSDWTYSVFWTIRPRPRVRGGSGCKVGDDNGSLMLMWEDGYCRGRTASDCLEDIDGEDPVRKAFSKMSIQLYNYGEGLMGKVASDKCHKWVFKEPTECEPNMSNYWQSSFDALPPEWNDQFDSGIQTIAVIQAGHGLLQLGSCKIIPEDLHFVLRMRHTFESLGYQSGFYLSQLFSSNRNPNTSLSIPTRQIQPPILTRPQSPFFNLGPRPLVSPNFSNSSHLNFPPKDETHMFFHPLSSDPQTGNLMENHENENDLKWPNGLSFFSALTGKMEENMNSNTDNNNNNNNNSNHNEFLSLDTENERKMENKYKRNFSLPNRMVSSSSSTSLDHHAHNPMEYKSNEGGMYPDHVMETF